MAEAGSFAERVKQQADIVRVVGEYVGLKKGGQNMVGLCPFHNEKTPSFAVHPVRQIYHCFGCGVGGDVFSFVMEMEKCSFPEAVKMVAEKCGIAVPREREHTPKERQENQQRRGLVELHQSAAEFFARQLKDTAEGRAAAAYLEDRGIDAKTIERFCLGYAPAAGDALGRFLKGKFSEKLAEASGLIVRDAGGRLYDRFRRRVMFPIAGESGKVIAFGGRSLGDDMPKYMNSPETPIYTKSSVLYHLAGAKEAIRKQCFAILVEGYMDVIAVARAGNANVVASCGTSLAEPQVKLLGRFARRVVVNYDSDAAGQSATERSLGLLLEQEFEIKVLELPGGADPDDFVRKNGAVAYQKALAQSPEYLAYLIDHAKKMDRSTPQGKLAAVNYLMPYVQKIPNRLLRSEWASRIASVMEVDEPVLRESLRRAAAERRSQLATSAEQLGPAMKPVEKRLIQMLAEAQDIRGELAKRMQAENLHTGLETEKIIALLIEAALKDERPDPAALAEALEPKDRWLFFAALFEEVLESNWEEAESCLISLKKRQVEAELASLQRQLDAKPPGEELKRIYGRKQLLQKELSQLRA
jgi:DNA primase